MARCLCERAFYSDLLNAALFLLPSNDANLRWRLVTPLFVRILISPIKMYIPILFVLLEKEPSQFTETLPNNFISFGLLARACERLNLGRSNLSGFSVSRVLFLYFYYIIIRTLCCHLRSRQSSFSSCSVRLFKSFSCIHPIVNTQRRWHSFLWYPI